jgi:peptidoglycan-N-acetylglucosamine deacetylase
MVFIKFNMNRKLGHKLLIFLSLSAVMVLYLFHYLPQRQLIREDVYFLGRNMQGYSPKETEELLVARFLEWQHNPVDALYDPERQVIVPELWGYKVDIEQTLNRILTASSGESVFPTLEPLYPELSIADYPAAFIEQGNPQKNEVALMINVAWGEEYLQPMLDVLAKENVKGTFFVVGRWAQKHEPLLREIASRGHELANHGHSDNLVYTKFTPAEMEDGLTEVNTLIKTATGQTAKYFTPHKGEYNQLVLEVVSRVGMRTVLWTVDTVDWNKPGVEKMKNKVLTKLTGGGIILMHPTEDTVTFLQETIPLIKQKGFDIVTLDRLFCPHYPPSIIRFSELQ